MNRSIAAVLLAIVVLLPVQKLARADNEPLLWPDGTIAYRDWGLYRPGVPILIERPYRCCYGPLITKSEGGPVASPYFYPSNTRDPYYFPSNRRDPDAYKMQPPIRPVPAEPWFRSWDVGSDPAPASIPAQVDVPVEGPAVIYAPKPGHKGH
ncbi:MAG TPA: hypothetical protein VHD34_04635 [Xanthobacteraceae bacterium]|nr:hypothetical protein [Xanthobacteraceae bacterium]